jgi:hypothetical protein
MTDSSFLIKSDLWPFPAVDGLTGSYSESEDTLREAETCYSTCLISNRTFDVLGLDERGDEKLLTGESGQPGYEWWG